MQWISLPTYSSYNNDLERDSSTGAITASRVSVVLMASQNEGTFSRKSLMAIRYRYTVATIVCNLAGQEMLAEMGIEHDMHHRNARS